jgi:histidinol-phosphatase (PHP family)
MLDYHLHLWAHGRKAWPTRLEELAAYCEQAQAVGVSEIALTEHFFRFSQADAVGRGFWDDPPAGPGASPALRRAMEGYWDEHQGADLDDYVNAVLEAKAAGLPVVLGLEVDYYSGRMDKVGALLDGYPFDVLLGSVHWIRAWGFDAFEYPVVADEWDRWSVEDVWRAYTESLEELAASGACDVLAHPDLCKVFGRVPAVPDEFYDRMAEAAASSGMAAEVSTAGWRKPIGEPYPAPALLQRFHSRGVPVTTASDAHALSQVADRVPELRGLLDAAGYTTLAAYRSRKPVEVDV